MIVCGFPGIGKSSICQGGSGFIDLDSSAFKLHGGKLNVSLYVQVATELSRQGNTVFVSTHQEVVDELLAMVGWNHGNFIFTVCYPSLNLYDFWCRKLLDRYLNDSKTNRNRHAFQFVFEHYEDAIEHLMEVGAEDGVIDIQINDSGYDLLQVLRGYSITRSGEGVIAK